MRDPVATQVLDVDERLVMSSRFNEGSFNDMWLVSSRRRRGRREVVD